MILIAVMCLIILSAAVLAFVAMGALLLNEAGVPTWMGGLFCFAVVFAALWLANEDLNRFMDGL